ncbi:LacI family DNA-binding transcriptional regulator [Microbacterium sp. SZ1]|uniref:LacI family DNA-binding transcriptional regulator n=1 Tax=Microbacterium sp. SZ1 TaxID=1849736 RepID=UPI000BBC04A4|nr:LacI family DNA-binding transcriptional regulator [Microbacterium sp. SZ1]
MSTISDVAHRAGVSKSTVSRALNGHRYVSTEIRDRVVRVAAELGYVADSSAASLASGRTRMIGLLTSRIDGWYEAEVTTGVQEFLIEIDHDLVLFSGEDTAGSRARLFRHALPRRRLDGVILVGTCPSPSETTDLASSGAAIVTVGTRTSAAPSVGIDEAAAGRAIAEHLISLGHQRIVFVDSSTMSAGASARTARAQGFKAAMRSAGLPARLRSVRGSDWTQVGFSAFRSALDSDTLPPTAIIGACDELALAVLAASRSTVSEIPDLSVAGIDGHPHSALFDLTTVQQRPRLQGYEAARHLHNLLTDPRSPVLHVTADARLVARGSSSPPPQFPNS